MNVWNIYGEIKETGALTASGENYIDRAQVGRQTVTTYSFDLLHIIPYECYIYCYDF